MGDPSWFPFLQNLLTLGDLASDSQKLTLFAYPSLNNPGPPVPFIMHAAHISEYPCPICPNSRSCPHPPPRSPCTTHELRVVHGTWQWRNIASSVSLEAARGKTPTSSPDPGLVSGPGREQSAGAQDAGREGAEGPVGDAGTRLPGCSPRPAHAPRGLFPPDPQKQLSLHLPPSGNQGGSEF
uniref:Uncharacterized protein n=1 Tax=Mus spicilegus TaxID=10103 RepID=A0A8C6I371_MUSSI